MLCEAGAEPGLQKNTVMSKQYAVMHLAKLKLGGVGAHIDRRHVSPNVNRDYSDLNKEYCPFPYGETLKQSINKRIEQGYTSCRKIRKDAVKSVGVILTGSHEQMINILHSGKINEWSEANKKWAESHFGKDNIVRFSLHMDERTPHIHCVFTPITPDGRLHYKHFVPNKQALIDLQDDYAKNMAEFGLLRGEKATKTKRKHVTTAEWYKFKNTPLKSLKLENEKLRRENKVIEKSIGELPPLLEQVQMLEFKNKQQSKSLTEWKIYGKNMHKKFTNLRDMVVDMGMNHNSDESISRRIRNISRTYREEQAKRNNQDLER